MIVVFGVWAFVRALLVNSATVSLENVALRHQLAVLQRSGGRPRFRRCDRIFWLWLARLWTGWPSQPRHCSARDRSRLASPSVSALLALEVPAPLSRSPAARS
jgi:hypothetical protein